MDNIREVVIEGLTEEDFYLLQKILATHKVSIEDEISYHDIVDLHDKICDILTHLIH